MTPTGYIATCTPHRQAVNIRAAASLGSKIVGVLKFRDVLPVCVVGSEWVRVDVGGVEAFIARHIVRVDMD